MPIPGHTPGHCSVLIESAGQRALISGDLFHHPVQVAHPEWPTVPDDDPVGAVATRARILPQLADDGRGRPHAWLREAEQRVRGCSGLLRPRHSINRLVA